MSNSFGILCLAAGLLGGARAQAADSDLDATFGTAGKVQIGINQLTPISGITGSVVASDIAIQNDGKVLVAGYSVASYEGSTGYCWTLERLNSDGSLEGTFDAGAGTAVLFCGGHPENQATSVAVRANGKILLGGTIRDDNNGLLTAVVLQFNADGTADTGWGSHGQVYFTPAPGDASTLRRLIIDTVGPNAIGTVYVAGQYTHGTNANNDFFYGGISLDGQSHVYNTLEASTGGNYSDSATDLAVQPGSGNIIVGGFATNAAGDVDCAAISTVIVPLSGSGLAYRYTPFGTGGVGRVGFDLAGDNNDFCDAIAIFPNSGNFVLGGHATANAGNGAYQAAIVAEFDSGGNPAQYFSGGLLYPAKYSFSYSLNPTAGQINTITKLMVDGYDTKYPQLLAVGSGNQYAVPQGLYFGLARLDPMQSYSNFSLDTAFNGAGVAGVYFAQRPTGLGNFITTNHGVSGAFAHGRLVAAGYTEPSSGTTDIAVTRLGAFDGVFKNGFETPSY